MRGKAIILLALLCTLCFGSVIAKNDTVSYHTNLYFLTANQSFQPHWQVSNRYGIFDRYTKNEFAGLFGLAYKHHFGKKFKLETEVEFNLRSDISTSYFQQVYFNFYYGSFQIKIGKEAYTIGQYSEELGSGSFFLSNNVRPIPRTGIGFYEYTAIPFIKKYLEFKGAINFGILDDDRSEFNGTDKPIFHEKFIYLRSKSLPVNLHAGLNHSAKLGGTSPNGAKIEKDFIATFFGQGSSKLGGGEESNAAGGHFGLYDFGLNWQIKNNYFQLYLQKPFSDGSGKKLQNKDKIIGLLYSSNKKRPVSSIIYEYINTMDQSGNGIPDPIVDGKFVIPYQIESFDQFMLENFDIIVEGMTSKEFLNYLEGRLNYGYEFNGRDDPYNNGIYRKGLTYQNENIGTSLFTTKANMQAINPDFSGKYDLFFVNNRIVAHHLAFEGYILPVLTYRTKLTYSKNFGSYAGANKGRFNWGSIEDPEYYNSYYFKDGLNQAYTFFELNYSPVKFKGSRFTTSFGYDFGEMYHDFGVLFGFQYNGFFKLKKGSETP